MTSHKHVKALLSEADALMSEARYWQRQENVPDRDMRANAHSNAQAAIDSARRYIDAAQVIIDNEI